MAITSGFFNSVDGDRKYNAEQLGNYFEGLVGNGIFESVGNKFVVTAGTGMQVNVGSGRAMIDCHWIKNDSTTTLLIDPSDVQLHRMDAVMLKLDTSESARSITLYVKKGTASQTPSPPSPTRTEKVYELCLAYVTVSAKATSISQSNISDMRGTGLCGYVTGLIKQVDTADLFLQYQTAFEEMTAQFEAYITAQQAAFDTWFESLTESLHVDTSILKYQNSVKTTGTTTEITIGISEYETGDILLTFINGVLFVEGSEYSISGTGSTAKIMLVNDIKGDNTITFVVIKSMIGGGVISTEIDEINGEVI